MRLRPDFFPLILELLLGLRKLHDILFGLFVLSVQYLGCLALCSKPFNDVSNLINSGSSLHLSECLSILRFIIGRAGAALQFNRFIYIY